MSKKTTTTTILAVFLIAGAAFGAIKLFDENPGENSLPSVPGSNTSTTSTSGNTSTPGSNTGQKDLVKIDLRNESKNVKVNSINQLINLFGEHSNIFTYYGAIEFQNLYLDNGGLRIGNAQQFGKLYLEFTEGEITYDHIAITGHAYNSENATNYNGGPIWYCDETDFEISTFGGTQGPDYFTFPTNEGEYRAPNTVRYEIYSTSNNPDNENLTGVQFLAGAESGRVTLTQIEFWND